MTKPSKQKRRLEQDPAPAETEEQLKRERSPDVANPRAKSSAHKKVTADKWNQ
jgi:hypothetical protein